MRVLVIGLSNLGDAVLTYPGLTALWEAYPDAEFHILAGVKTLSLFAGEPRFRKVWVWDKEGSLLEKLRLMLRLAGLQFQVVVDFRNSLIPLALIGSTRTPIFRKPLPGISHRALQHLSLVTGLIPVRPEQSWRMNEAGLPFGSEDEHLFGQLLSAKERIVVMAPGSRSHLKRWPSQRFAKVADRLVERHGVKVLLIGGLEDIPVSESVRRETNQPVLDFTGQTTLRQTTALLAHAKLLITNDSACLHVAQAQGTPTVAIFGPTDEKKYGPRNSNSVVVRRAMVCAPCEKALCVYNHECLQQLDAEEVLSAAEKILMGDCRS